MTLQTPPPPKGDSAYEFDLTSTKIDFGGYSTVHLAPDNVIVKVIDLSNKSDNHLRLFFCEIDIMKILKGKEVAPEYLGSRLVKSTNTLMLRMERMARNF